MKTIEEKAKEIFGARAATYTASAPHVDRDALAKVIEAAQPQPTWTALDIATGTGNTAFALAPHVANVIGLDLTPEMLAQAEAQRAARGLTNVSFREGDVHALPFADASFDLVVSRLAPHHFSNLKHALNEIRRVLRSGGRLVIDDRSVPEDDFVDACMNELDWYHDESHVRQYRPSEWQKMLSEAGFVVEGVEPYSKLRPLTSLTANVSEENVRKVYARLAGLKEEEQQKLGLTEINGEPYLNHWYVLLSAHL